MTPGEIFPANRMLEDEVEGTEMAGVVHLGQYVFEMTKAKIESLKVGGGQLPMIEATPEMMKMDADEEDGVGGDPVAEDEDIDGVE